MISLTTRFLGLGVLGLGLATALSLVRADEKPASDKPALVAEAGDEKPEALPADAILDPTAMAERINKYIEARWAEVRTEKNDDGTNKEVKSAAIADDAEFFRRLCLDLNGRIPTITQLKDFLDDTRADKRKIWTDELMNGRDNADMYVNHFTTFWRNVLFAQATNQQLGQNFGFQLQPWLTTQVKENKPYDTMVRELFTGQYYQTYAQSNENKAETIAGATTRIFLGVKLECAQCHDDKSGGQWTRTQFWENAAFFSNNRQITIPDLKKTVQAKFLDGTSPDWKGGKTPQAMMADWMTKSDNPFFAKAFVNRMWGYFLGVGIVDPIDAASENNLPSHPELLDELAHQFMVNKYDVKWLIRAITATKAYQLTSARSHSSQDDPRLFNRMTVRGMTPEQLWDSISEATGIKSNERPVDPRFNPFGPQGARAEFIAKFNNTADKRTETNTSILQALYLMNGQLMANSTSLEKSKTLETVANAAASITTARRIEELYIVTLSRKPKQKELDRLVKYVDEGGPAKDPKKALQDVFWVLLNSGEFMLNH